MSLWTRVETLLAPFSVIARELTTIRELYEMELQARDKPIVRVTVKPSKGDTEIFYAGDEDTPATKKRNALARLFGGGDDDGDFEQDSGSSDAESES